MKVIYNLTDLYNLTVVKEVRRWMQHGLITEAQLDSIRLAHVSRLYHPNLIIRILLFIATTFALGGVFGIFLLMLGNMDETGYGVVAVVISVAAFVFTKQVLVGSNHHYKSGVVEAIVYHASGYLIGGVGLLTDANVHILLLFSALVFVYVSICYLDLISTACAVLAVAGLLFFECYEAGGLLRQIIPFVMIVAFSGVYFLIRQWKKRPELDVWHYPLIVVEALSLLLIYAGGNYMVVRELSVGLMDMNLDEGQDIPFAFVFYALTIIIPLLYLYRAIRTKDVVMLRVALLILAFSVFTFKFYFSLGHPEITLTIAGAVLLAVAWWLFQYLKTPRAGFTRENLLKEKWGDQNLGAFVISQTMGGNVAKKESFTGGGGDFGGGGASGGF